MYLDNIVRVFNSSSNTANNTRKSITPIRPRATAPTDAEIIDIHALRCAVPSPTAPPDDGISPSNDNEKHLAKQMEYIHSCVRKDKGLFGKLLLIPMI